MTDRSVIHDTFSLERTYPATPSRVFAAFASVEAKNEWGATSEVKPSDDIEEFDFRPGGRERFTVMRRDTTYRSDALYYDIVPDQRIVYSYEMYADGVRISVSIATIELVKSAGGTTVIWTEQGTYLDGIDGVHAPALRVGGTEELLDSLTRYLRDTASGHIDTKEP
ncbi:SRPBCC domain-containing protein [Hamadaea tsunoensis]|uniref:SRPBCC domain-containing protein n=1 Tax=Hamadaea tsunoensis TaxID=53368 RepID=UPI000401D1FA|nr:SRPBCC domain-containing protein [Hamadaea tsunoensis]